MPTTRLPDKATSRAVLIGVADYSVGGAAADLPEARRNVETLHRLLSDDEHGVFAAEHCRQLVDLPADTGPAQMLRAVGEASAQAEDLLLVYYAGHGHIERIDGRDELYLIQTATPHDLPQLTSIPFTNLHQQLKRARARVRILILDCCYSGEAARRTLAEQDPARAADRHLAAKFTDSEWYILTASRSDETAGASGEDGHTVFTGRLADILRRGIPDGEDGTAAPEYLDVETLYGAIKRTLAAIDPDQQPQLLARPSGGARIALAHNRARPGGQYRRWQAEAVARYRSWTEDSSALPGRDELGAHAEALVAKAAQRCVAADATPADPWRSPNTAWRMGAYLDEMVRSARARGVLDLSLPEAALLTVLPALYTAWWDVALTGAQNEIAAYRPEPHAQHRESTRAPRAATPAPPGYPLGADIPATGLRPRLPADADHAENEAHSEPAAESFSAYVARYEVLARRAESARQRGNPATQQAVLWWLYRAWIVGQCLTGRRPDPLADLFGSDEPPRPAHHAPPQAIAGLIRATFHPGAIDDLMRCLLAEATPERKLRSRTAGPNALPLRLDLLAKLAMVALRMSIDPAGLPGVVDQLTVDGGFHLDELHRLDVQWQPLGLADRATGRIADGPAVGYDLTAACSQQAVELLLREHCSALDAFVLKILRHTPDVDSVLRGVVPLRFTALGVGAATGTNGRSAYEYTDTRFSLDDDRIRELLMGDRLYGDPALAYRELYQNALDACRLRDTRLTYLKMTATTPVPPWSGRIVFTAGVDEGRAYVECADNGVGMGRRELFELFSRGGTRFASSVEFLKERAQWREAGIGMTPNSRFGIGVFSYFMMADQIRVTTCRFERDGTPGEHLQVDVAGPGSLFEVKALTTPHAAGGGTTVRLFLKPGLDAAPVVNLLRRLVWLCDYDLEAHDALLEDTLVLKAGELSEQAPIGAADPYLPDAARDGSLRLEPESRAPDVCVWWCSSRGGVLCDGVWMGRPAFGAVVNLTGAQAPALTIDRLHPRHRESVDLPAILLPHVDTLLSPYGTVFESSWLADMAEDDMQLADALFAVAAERRHQKWNVGRHDVDISAVGCFLPETNVGMLPEPESHYTWDAPRVWDRDASIEPEDEWRARAWTKTGLIPGLRLRSPETIPIAFPSDSLILDARTTAQAPDRVPLSASPVPAGHVIRVSARIGVPPGFVVERLRRLGLDVSRLDGLPLEADAVGLNLVNYGKGANGPWRLYEDLVKAYEILQTARQHAITPDDVRSRIYALGYDTTEAGRFVEWSTSYDDQLLGALSTFPDATARVDEKRALRIAEEEQLTFEAVAQRCTQMDISIMFPPRKFVCGECEVTMTPDALPFRHALHLALDNGADFSAALKEAAIQGFRLPEKVATVSLPDWLTTQNIVKFVPEQIPWPGGEPLSYARLTRLVPVDRVREILPRLAQLGYEFSAAAWINGDATDQMMLEVRAVVLAVTTGRPLRRAGVVTAALAGRIAPPAAAKRLRYLGVPIEDDADPPRELTADDRVIARSVDPYYGGMWLDPDRPVRFQHVVLVAALVGLSPRSVCTRLAQLGFSTPDPLSLPLRESALDSVLLKRGTWGHDDEWLELGPVSLVHILRVAFETDATPKQVADRLLEIGYTLPDDVEFFDA